MSPRVLAPALLLSIVISGVQPEALRQPRGSPLEGVLEVATRIDNVSVEPMPVAIGFHPHFQLSDSARDEWVHALKLAHKGVYKDLQSMPPAGVWQESFWIGPGGF